ncbi:PfkB family carbohydrate kinase [Massilia sp. PWRC2]|uniref:PfkB family carbohydrate kinase n=1 Tax=Massilia sp. PWRC2 TaxID=2804626 RepID=UPI003CEEAF9E
MTTSPLPAASDASIVLFGEALIDDFATVQVVGGAPFNVARHLAAFAPLACPPLMITRIGSDDNGARVLAEFSRFAMRVDGLQSDASAPTGRVLVEADGDSHRFIILPDQAYDAIDGALACTALARCTPSTIYFGTLAQRSAGARTALATLLAATPHAARRFLDLNLRDGQTDAACVFASLHEADVVKVNEYELGALFDWCNPAARPAALVAGVDMRDIALRMACVGLMDNFGVLGLIVTLGPHGAVYLAADGSYVTAAAAAAPALVDTVGAGDAFSAIYLLGSTLRWPLATTLQRANAFAAAVCGIAGAVPADLTFYEPWLLRWLAD